MVIDLAGTPHHLRLCSALVLALLIVPAVSAGGEVSSPAIAMDGLTAAESDWVWARWTSSAGGGKPAIAGSSAFAIEVWAYEQSAPDPVTGDIEHNVTLAFSGPASILHAVVGTGYEVLLASTGEGRIVATSAVVKAASPIPSIKGHAGSIPFPIDQPGNALEWTPGSTSTLYATGNVQLRLWEVSLGLLRPDGTTTEFHSGAQPGSLGQPGVSRELLVNIMSGEASVFSAASAVKTLQTSAVAGTLVGRFALQGNAWSDAPAGLAPFVENHEFKLSGANGVTGTFNSIVEDRPGGPGLVTSIVDPEPVEVAATSVWIQPPAWLWAVTAASLILAACLAGIIALHRSAEAVAQRMRAATVAKEHDIALRAANRLLSGRHRGEAAATAVQATLELYGPKAALASLESKRVSRALDPAIARMLRALVLGEMGDRDGALLDLDEAYRADPALGKLLGIDLGPASQERAA